MGIFTVGFLPTGLNIHKVSVYHVSLNAIITNLPISPVFSHLVTSIIKITFNLLHSLGTIEFHSYTRVAANNEQ